MQLKVDIDRERIADWFGPDGTHRLPEQALPAVLAHEPTRRLLTVIGLPSAGGALLRFDSDPDTLLSPLATRLAGPSIGADHLLVLGEAGYRDWLVLDGVTGQVALATATATAAATEPAEPARVLLDVIASDLSVVLLFLHELEALRTGAADPTAHDGRRGPAVVAEVTAALAQRMRAVDPAVFEPSGLAPHWSTALLVYGLRWVAHPGAGAAGQDERPLAYEITPELVADLGEVVPLHPDDLPECLRHEPTRRLLTTVGLPASDYLRDDEERPFTTLRECCPWYAEDEENTRAHQLDYVCLGDTVYDCQVVVDGTTGRVEITEGDGEEGWPAAHLHSDLSAFYVTIWVVTRLSDEAARWTRGREPADWKVFTPDRLLAEAGLNLLIELDPSAFEHKASFWNARADDGHMGGLLG